MLARSSSPKMTVDQFLKMYEGVEGRFELVDGQAYAMAGGSATHAFVAGNVLSLLRQALRRTGCRPFNSDMGLRLTDDTLRYPDIAVYCDPRDLDLDLNITQSFRHPSLVLEVLSPSTRVEDRAVKVLEYKGIVTVEAIVLIDPLAKTIEVHERLDGENWLHRLPAAGIDLVVKKPALTLANADIFDLS
jgi:Uma2 family endonuclease